MTNGLDPTVHPWQSKKVHAMPELIRFIVLAFAMLTGAASLSAAHTSEIVLGRGSQTQAYANTDDPSGRWKGTCTKFSTGATWDAQVIIHDDGTYIWTSTFPATSDNPGWTTTGTGRVDRTSGQLRENENKSRTHIYSVLGNRMHVISDMSECWFTRSDT
ncbi:hypothetical protein [Microbispora sp. NPDC049633]|uniref:hypothetical protein n=1 Tax=Microbispora sp. NPDC049633 TaxID=3154355 RepID=UPI0034491145